MEAAATYVIGKIDNFVATEFRLRESIEERIKELESEHEIISEVLQGENALRSQGDVIRVWFQQLQGINYDIESVVGKYAYMNATRNANPWYDRFSRMSHPIDKKIQEIEKKLMNIKDKGKSYLPHIASSSTPAAHQQGTPPLSTRDAEIVGVEGPRKELASWILDLEQAYKAMFVVGMGGSGKTALVKIVYEQLKTDFDCHVWLTASEYVHLQDLLSTMYNKLLNQTGQSSSNSSPQDLVDMLINYLQGKRYLIVLDNWNRKDWESVKRAFPNDNISSRVIITTRRGDLASLCRDTSVNIYDIPPLPYKEARELFQRKAFCEGGTIDSVPGLSKVSERLLRKCEGLPLGIIEIGKHLCPKAKSLSVFEDFERNLQDELQQLSSISQVLLSSYYDLPHHLKCCFKYMSMFPEGHPVNCRMMIRLWMAEGFIRGGNQNEPEDIGERYLDELIKMNLVHASELKVDGRPRTCRLHNLMHKIVLSKSKEDNFCNVTRVISEKMLRVSMQETTELIFQDKELDHLRTFFSSSYKIRIPRGAILSMKLLKILHLDHANLEALPEGIKKLLLLKYLSVRDTNIKRVPISTGRLEQLETLNLKQTFVTELPESLLSLENLRHLLLGRYRMNDPWNFDVVQGVKVPKGISRLTNLQKLSFVRADKDHKLIQELQKLKKLRKLGIVDLPSESGPILCGTIEELTSLRSLSMASQNMDEVLKIHQEIDKPPLLQRLYMRGRLEMMPQWISKLHELVRIRLMWSRLPAAENPITILGKLRNLLELELLNAYTWSQLDFCAGMFPKLKILKLEQMKELQVINIDNGALPCLEKFSITLCKNLRRIPSGVTNATQLIELHLKGMPLEFVVPLKRNGALRSLVRNVDICSYHLQNGTWVLEDICQREGY